VKDNKEHMKSVEDIFITVVFWLTGTIKIPYKVKTLYCPNKIFCVKK
jgi:hypothetical protein